MKRLLSLFLPLLVVAACTEPVVDTFGNIGGTVSDASTGAPLSGVSVMLTPTGYSQVTNNNGTFQFDNLDVQEYTLTFSRSGYVTYQHKVTVKPGLSSSVQVSLRVADLSLPTVVLGNATNLTPTSVRVHATLTSVGSSAVTQHGFCYAEHSLPTTADECINLGSMISTGQFSQDITGLSPSTTYYLRAYAQNGGGLVYSDEITLSTPESGGGEGSGIAVASGLMLYYTFDKEDCTDATEMQIDAVAFGNPSYIDDSPSGQGKAVFLNGAKQQYISINYNLFKGRPNFSMSLWIKDFSTGSVLSGIATGYYREYYSYPRLYFASDGKIAFECRERHYDNSPKFSYPYSSLQADAWHHLAVTCDNGVLKLYIDGTLTDTMNDTWVDPKDSAPKFYIGGNGDEIYPVFFSGKLDNIRLYNRTVSGDDVKEIYNAEK